MVALVIKLLMIKFMEFKNIDKVAVILVYIISQNLCSQTRHSKTISSAGRGISMKSLERGAITFNITTLSIATLSMVMLSITKNDTLSIMTFSMVIECCFAEFFVETLPGCLEYKRVKSKPLPPPPPGAKTISLVVRFLTTGNPYWRGRLSTVDHLIHKDCLVKKENIVSVWKKLFSTN